MALMKCPECGREVSDCALACPQCGYPIKKCERTQYSLRLGRPSANGFATFLMICAVICWIGGLIISYSGANIPSSYRYTTEFSFATFITLFIPYIVYGIILFCMSSVVSQISATYDIVSGLYLETTQIKESSNEIHTPKQHPQAKREQWKCPKCGSMNPTNALSCRDCGEYR